MGGCVGPRSRLPPSQPAAHSAAVAAARLRSCLRRSCGRAGVRRGDGREAKTAAKVQVRGGRKRRAQQPQAAARFLGVSVRRGGWGGSRGARAGEGVIGPAMADNEKLDKPTAWRISRTKAATWKTRGRRRGEAMGLVDLRRTGGVGAGRGRRRAAGEWRLGPARP